MPARLLSAAQDYAELAVRAADAGAELTAARTRTLPHGNAPRAADDPQFHRVLGESAARAAVATAAQNTLLRATEEGTATDEEARLAVIGLAALSRQNVHALFETLGASSTLEDNGLHLLWQRQQDLELRDGILSETVAAGAARRADVPPLRRNP